MKRLIVFAFLISGIDFSVGSPAYAQVPDLASKPITTKKPTLESPEATPNPVESTPQTAPVKSDQCFDAQFQVELRKSKPQKEIYFRLLQCTFAADPHRYFFPLPKGEEYPPDIRELSQSIPNIREIVLLKDGLLFRGDFRDWERMANVILDKLNLIFATGGYHAFLSPPLVDCTLASAECKEMNLPSTFMAKGGQ
jgi:hypothetical protein